MPSQPEHLPPPGMPQPYGQQPHGDAVTKIQNLLARRRETKRRRAYERTAVGQADLAFQRGQTIFEVELPGPWLVDAIQAVGWQFLEVNHVHKLTSTVGGSYGGRLRVGAGKIRGHIAGIYVFRRDPNRRYPNPAPPPQPGPPPLPR